MERRVAITGIGTVNAAGLGREAAWQRLRVDPPKPVRYTGPPPAEDIEFPVFAVEPYHLGDLSAGGMAAAERFLEREGFANCRDLVHLLASTALALEDAGLPRDGSAEELPAAVVVGDESPGFEPLSRALFALGRERPLPDGPVERYRALAEPFFQLNTFLLPHFLARAFRFSGLALFVNSACTSGLNALEIAAQEIRAGRSRLAVAAAADDPLSVAKFLWFKSLGLYAMDGVVRPFDPDGTGIVFGDGGAALVLEELASARARGARIYAEYLGAGFAQDGWKITVPSPNPLRAVDALHRAFAESGVHPGEVDLVVPHGVGSAAADQYEAAVLHQVFGGGDRPWPLVTALKPSLGHNLGGSALLDLTVLLQAIERSQVPPTLGHARPLARNPVPLVGQWLERPIGTAVKLTCGFAGYYGAAVFRRVTR
jgi:3-oxoacyl-[acyl-carrier-protein] synthase II